MLNAEFGKPIDTNRIALKELGHSDHTNAFV